MKSKFLGLVPILLGLGCSDHASERSGEPTASAAQNLTIIPQSGFVPYPVLVDEDGLPVEDINGDLIAGWDGSLAELLAADAFAQCLLTSAFYKAVFSTNARGLDEQLFVLWAKMAQSPCKAPPPEPIGDPAEPVERWFDGRMNPACNIEPTTGLKGAVPLPERDVSAYLGFADTFRTQWQDFITDTSGGTGAGSSGFFNMAEGLSYSELNLCMAQKLEEQLNTASVVFSSDEEQIELRGFIRERAQLSMLQYASLAKILSAPGPRPSTINNEHQFLSFFRAWAEQPSANSPFGGQKSLLEQIGDDFATSVRLHLDATYEFAALLRRQASARPQLTELGSRPQADWSDFTPRVGLLNLLYGGDALTTGEVPGPGRGFGGVLKDLPFVEGDMRSPEMGTLLALARFNDLLLLKVVDGATTAAESVDIEASSERLYVEVERALRQHQCDFAGEDPCPAANNVPPIADYAEYLLWQEHRVTPEHARTLVRVFSQALGGVALGSLEDSGPGDGYGHGAAVFHFLGQHAITEIDGDSWLRFDPDFDMLPLQASELNVRFDAGQFLPAQMDLGANAYQQGFITQRELLFEPHHLEQFRNGAGGTWNDFRSLGAVQALAYAREAVLQGSLANEDFASFFTGPNRVLPLIEKAAGETTAAVRPAMVAVDKTSCTELGTTGSSCRVLEQERDGNQLVYQVDVLTTPDDPHTEVAAGDYQREIENAAFDSDYESFRGVTRADLDGLSRNGADSTVTYDIDGLERENRRFTVTQQLEPGSDATSCNAYIETLSNGDLRFVVTFNEPQCYVEAFSQKNGIQNVAGNIVSSEVANGNGTYTYSRVKSGYVNGDQVKVRFYSYKCSSPGVFTPGPTSSVWSDIVTYGVDECFEEPPPPDTSNASSVTFLRGEIDGEPSYAALNELPRRTYGGYYVGFGGELNGIAERTWAVRSENWSAPAIDAFDLPLDWVPPADASLVGGTAGQESYQYYLASAEAAAEEATAAVQTAIDTLVAEATDALALENADKRAEEIGNIEQRALCGDSETCEVPTEVYDPEVGTPCAGEGLTITGEAFCNTLMSHLDSVLVSMDLPSVVVDQLVSEAPDFSEFGGGELERILTAQWSALRNVVVARNTALEATISEAHNLDAADAALVAAEAELAAALEQAEAQIALLGAQADGLEVDRQALLTNLDQLRNQQKWQCCTGIVYNDVNLKNVCQSPECGLEVGMCSGISYSGDDLEVRVGINADGIGSYRAKDISSKSYNPGPLQAAKVECNKLTEELVQAEAEAEPRIAAIDAQITALADEEAEASGVTAAMEAERAANAKYAAAVAANAGVRSELLVGFGAHLTLSQQAVGELLKAASELNSAISRKELAVARADLEADLANREIEARFGLRRKFQSYDLWRARALLENTRRLAVAARRAIEARFVVDLSELDASQAFVEAPSLWADGVYDTDLSAPAAVGLTLAPTIEGALFPNKLKDYVGNLKRFVQGYTVAFPTSVASPDTEVLSIPGPDVRVTDAIGEEGVEHVSSESAGWRFFCEADAKWREHPGLTEYPIESSLDTLCEGKPPARARYTFFLDPWARLREDFATDPFTERHNVRWRRFALNLVGTGIRDCQRAADPIGCYSDSFIRYAFKHVGPAWVTNHSQQWRAFDIPTGQVEGGKALATEEWLDPISNSWNQPFVSNVARGELFGRPVGGAYELVLELTPDLRLERLERIQVLVETDYWVRQD